MGDDEPMTLRQLLLMLPLAALFSTGAAQAATADQLLGIWSAGGGESKIEVTKCGDRYCGSIVWMKTPHNDVKNEDASLRGRELVGARILNDFKFDGAMWVGGKLYGPERGKSMEAKLALIGDDTLEIRVSAGLVKKNVTWTRVK